MFGLAAAGAMGFEVFVTADQNLMRQNDIARTILRNARWAVVVLGTNDWKTIERNPGPKRLRLKPAFLAGRK